MDEHRRPRHRSIDQISSVNRCREVRLHDKNSFFYFTVSFFLLFFFFRVLSRSRASYRSSLIKKKLALRVSFRRALLNLRVRIPSIATFSGLDLLSRISLDYLCSRDRTRIDRSSVHSNLMRTPDADAVGRNSRFRPSSSRLAFHMRACLEGTIIISTISTSFNATAGQSTRVAGYYFPSNLS